MDEDDRVELRFCANLKWLFTELPFERRFEAAAQSGFSAVEFASPYEFRAGLLADLLAENGLRQILINTPVGPPGSPTRSGAACLPGQVGAFQDGVRRALDYATALGSPLLHVMAGVRPAEVSVAAASAVYQSNIAWAVEQAAAAGVRVVLEAINQRDVPGYFLACQEQARDTASSVGSTDVGLLFDVYHCQVSQGDVTTRLKDLMPWVAHIQVADPPTRSEPGTGELGWRFLFEQLRLLGYRGWIGCEYRPLTTTLSGLGWRQALGGTAARPGHGA